MRQDPRVLKSVDAGTAYYTIFWSPLKKAERYDIATNAPSMAGIYELYYMDSRKKLNRFFFAKAWYGGLRNHLRMTTDPELVGDAARRRVLETHDCYYRYALLESFADMTDILFFFAALFCPSRTDLSPSRRYQEIFVKEISADKLVTI